MASPNPIEHHVTAIATRSQVEHDRFAYAMLDRAWPEGIADFRSTIGSEWLQRWQPLRPHTAEYACRCPNGRCAVCN